MYMFIFVLINLCTETHSRFNELCVRRVLLSRPAEALSDWSRVGRPRRGSVPAAPLPLLLWRGQASQVLGPRVQ